MTIRLKFDDDSDAYKVQIKEFKKLIRQKQRGVWRAHCGEIEYFLPPARLQWALTKYPYREIEKQNGSMHDAQPARKLPRKWLDIDWKIEITL